MKSLFLSFLLLSSSAYAVDYTTTYTWPNCVTPDAETYTISDDAGWDKVKDLDGTYTKFCVEPGDYKSAGDIDINDSCTLADPCQITYYKSGETYENAIDQASPATIQSINWDEKSHWHVRGLSVNDSGSNSSNDRPVQIGYNSDNIVLDGVLIEGGRKDNVLISRGSDDVVIQDSVIRNSNRFFDESDCISIIPGEVGLSGVYQNIDDLVLASNEIYNCNGDNIQVKNSGTTTAYGLVDAIIADNDLYNADYRTDCNGSSTVGGDCACGAAALNLETSATAAANQLLVTENSMWGFRLEDSSSGSSGYCPGTDSTAGFAITIPSGLGYINFTKNLIFDAGNGIITETGVDGIIINQNVFYQITTDDNALAPRAALMLGGQNTVTENVISDSNTYFMVNTATSDGWVVMEDNSFIDLGGDWSRRPLCYRLQTGSAVGDNDYYDAECYALNTLCEYDHDYATGGNSFSASETGIAEDYCVTIKQHTDPESYCVPDGSIYITSEPPVEPPDEDTVPSAPTGGELIIGLF